ncbi:zinc-binding dehydrogenase [Streptomonospora wellingtoniae]|uniref:Zinc-binding dehydrogenase n=1 Tax=Streptomonospora wellingtoniae TaxID=3075544 RepID=A0ABU2L111_9ACTN|nr:zinc-binding dehydrogenase [Streptomonospora sp. DSM 45055]MDT0305238.1 zinc-binding dehydrogenase [Streptomonospora sp. DSM 45055]
MQTVQAARFGGPEVLEAGEAPDPVAGEGEVVIEVAAADVIMLDVLVRRGAPGPWAVEPPYVPGTGVAGRVASVGTGVDAGWIGRGVAAKPGRAAVNAGSGSVAEAAEGTSPTGGYAQLAVAPADALLEVPEGVALREAAALVNDGMTAMQISQAARIGDGEKVLVMPAGGGLGSLLVQRAAAAGATVIAAAKGRRKLDLARELGADHAFDYSESDWLERVRQVAGDGGVDVVLDGVGGEIGRASFDAAARGGRFFAFGAPSGGFTRIDPQESRDRGVSVVGLMELPMEPGDQKRLPEAALAEAAAGRLKPTVGQSYPLKQASDAHSAIEGRAVVGKTLLLP